MERQENSKPAASARHLRLARSPPRLNHLSGRQHDNLDEFGEITTRTSEPAATTTYGV